MMDNKVQPRTLPGFMELLPQDQILFNQMVDKIRKSYEIFGFVPLDTPVIELSEVLLAKAGGETEKQIYRFSKGESDVALRFDLTVPLAKFVTENYNDLAFPFRRYQIGKVYRGEKPQKGRFREFYQCDIDVIGDGELSIVNDAEIPSIIYTTFKELGFDEFKISVNNRKILNGFFESLNLESVSADILRIIDKVEKIGRVAVSGDLIAICSSFENEFNSDAEIKVEKIMNFIDISGSADEKIKALTNLGIDNVTFQTGVEELAAVVRGIRLFGVPDEYFTVDLKIARGLDYYTGTVYETFLNGYEKLGSVCSGGRFDNLAEYYTDKKLPGVGISIGLTRLFYQLNQMQLIKADKKSIAEVLVLPMDEETIDSSLSIAKKLREFGLNTEVYLDTKQKMKKKMKYANKLNIPYVIFVGENEIKTGEFTCKNMSTSQQMTGSIEEIIKKINS